MNGILRAILLLPSFTATIMGGHVMSPWSTCSVSCGYGVQTRHRIELRSSGKDPYLEKRQRIEEDHQEHRQCVIHCPVDGVWGPWQTSSACSKTCGDGLKALTRLCNHPAPMFGGDDCAGDSNGTQPCNTFDCPIVLDVHLCDKVAMMVAVFSHSSVHHRDAQPCTGGDFVSSRAPLLNFCGAPSNTAWKLGNLVTDMRCEDRVAYTPIFMHYDHTGEVEYGIYSGCHNGTIEVVSQNCSSPLMVHHVLEADAAEFRFLTW